MNPGAIIIMWALSVAFIAAIAVGNSIAIIALAVISAIYAVWAIA